MLIMDWGIRVLVTSPLLNAELNRIKNHSFLVAHHELSEEIINAESIPVFKRKMKIWLKMENSSNNFDIRDHSYRGFLGKILIQMRFELSPLRSHLFKYNLMTTPSVPLAAISSKQQIIFLRMWKLCRSETVLAWWHLWIGWVTVNSIRNKKFHTFRILS